jgi:asparagine synthase (glutamine-hydrolysing)
MEINILQSANYGWKRYRVGNYSVIFKGYLLNNKKFSIFKKIHFLLNKKNFKISDFSCLVKNLLGHFSIIIYNSKKVFCVVDHVRSIPLFYHYNNKKIYISSSPLDILRDSTLRLKSNNMKAALEIAMSGFTIGNKTLSENIFQLEAGQLLLLNNNKININQYYFYKPWKEINSSKSKLKKRLTKNLLDTIKRTAKSCEKRQILIPLSGGYDSRLIASGLRKIGVKNVVCFSYGLKNNFESNTAEKIAKRLGYEYIYIPTSLSEQKKNFNQKIFKKFLQFTDTLCNSPVLIDYSIIKKLYQNKRIKKNAIIINGNSGDFISGGHVFSEAILRKKININQIIELIFNKHFNLWNLLKSNQNNEYIKKQIYLKILEISKKYIVPRSKLWAVAESFEWITRQSKWVTTTQRSYEFFGFDWRLPLWDPLLMKFWQSIPLKFKLKQNLYKEVLIENNWGDVWKDIGVNKFRLPSNNLFYIREFLKLFFVFFGKKNWKQFDKRFFLYFYDNTASTAIVKYSDVLLNKDVAKDRNSWISKKYLIKKNIQIV